MHFLPRLLAAALLLPAWPTLRADAGTIGVNVVMDFTAAGKKLTPPTAEHPVYYLPLPVGDVDKGDIDVHWQRPQPPPEIIESQIARMLTGQHYLLMTKTFHPTMVLTFMWGYKKAIVVGPHHVSLNDAEMEDLVGGGLVDGATAQGWLNARDKELNRMAHEARWYLTITALDFNDWKNNHKTTELWRENISTELWGHYLDQVLPTMIVAGGPLIGRPMLRPTAVNLPLEAPPPGWVTVGKPVVVPDGK